MDDLLLIDAAERYLRDEMSEQERTYFEEIRKNNPEIDQLVVEHIFSFMKWIISVKTGLSGHTLSKRSINWLGKVLLTRPH